MKGLMAKKFFETCTRGMPDYIRRSSDFLTTAWLNLCDVLRDGSNGVLANLVDP